MISKSAEHGAEMLTHVWREANMAQAYLGMLPIESQELENTEKFLNQVSEYSYALSRKNIEGTGLTDEDIEKIKEIMANLDKQKEKQEEIINGNSKWIENFKAHKNITELDRDIITELIDYIEVHEDKKITIHFKFMDELDKILEYIENENKASIFEKVKEA